MNSKLFLELEKLYKKEVDVPKIGDLVEVGIKIKDKDNERVQYFKGIVIRKSGCGTSKTFTVRKIGANGIGVELIIPLHSNFLVSIKLLKKARRVRRAKLYYLRDRVGKLAMNM